MIRTNDYWNAQLYDYNHTFVSKYGSQLIDMLQPQPGEKILDLGCGTGDLANELSTHDVTIIGVDQSANMITQAKKKYPHISFELQDATHLPYMNEFDAVFSNAVLHWVKQPKQALDRIYRSLKPGGRFIAEFGGKGNVESITTAIIEQYEKAGYSFQKEQFPWYFPSIGEYTSLMEQAGFRVVYAHHFDRPTLLDGENGLNNWIEMFGTNFFTTISPEQKNSIVEKTKQQLEDILYIDNSWIADYKRLRIIGLKE